MAVFPSYVQVAMGSMSEDRAPVVLRSEMERGVPKQRRMASDTMVSVTLTMAFKTLSDHTAFEAWFDSQIGSGTDWFDWTHPRTGTVVRARFMGGKLGALAATHGTYKRGRCQRTATLEYLRSAY
jgi:hypothetical protein